MSGRAWWPAGGGEDGGLEIPYSPMAVSASHIHVSGQISLDEDGAIVGDDFASQARRTFGCLRAELERAGASMDDVVHVTTYLVRREDFDAFNEAMAAAFTPPYPARCTVLGQLIMPELLIEVSAVAVRRP